MSEQDNGRAMPTGRALGVGLAIVAAGVGWGLATHPGFQPVAWLRIGAPIAALLLGAGFARLVALARAPGDAEREFDRGGKALFMGFAMVTATVLAWLLLSQALPAGVTSATGAPRDEAGVVVRKVPRAADPECAFRLEVRSAADGGAVPRPLDECVDESVWRAAVDGGPVTLRIQGGAFGADLTAVASAGAAH